MDSEAQEVVHEGVLIETLDPQEPLEPDHPEYSYVPGTDMGKRPPGKYCMARKTSENEDGDTPYCKNPAGRGTDHVGIGRCKFHGGMSVTKHGYYSQLKRYGKLKGSLGELYEKYMSEDEDPLDVIPELALMRALLEDFVSDYERHKEALYVWRSVYAMDKDTEPPKLNLPSIHSAYKMIGELSKAIDREQRRKEATAISLKELYRLMSAMGQAVRDIVLNDSLSNQEKLKEINKSWSKLVPKK